MSVPFLFVCLFKIIKVLLCPLLSLKIGGKIMLLSYRNHMLEKKSCNSLTAELFIQ